MQRPGTGEGAKRSLRSLRQTVGGKSLSAHKTTRRLLLLHFRFADRQKRSRPLLRRNGLAHDKSYTRRQIHHEGNEISF